jgi:hypothetical protein
MDYKELMRACSYQKLNHESRTNMRGSEMLDLPNVVDGACGIPVAQFLPSLSLGFHYFKYTSVRGLIQYPDYKRFGVPAACSYRLVYFLDCAVVAKF